MVLCVLDVVQESLMREKKKKGRLQVVASGFPFLRAVEQFFEKGGFFLQRSGRVRNNKVGRRRETNYPVCSFSIERSKSKFNIAASVYDTAGNKQTPF